MAERVLTDEEIARRAPLWCALAELFLDTEIQVSGYHAIARAAREGDFSAEGVREALEREVFPAFIFNLMNIAGEWAAFHPDDVRERVLGVLGQPGGYSPPPRLWTNGMRLRFIEEEWPRIEAALEGREPVISATPEPPPKPVWPGFAFGICLAVIVIGLALVLARP